MARALLTVTSSDQQFCYCIVSRLRVSLSRAEPGCRVLAPKDTEILGIYQQKTLYLLGGLRHMPT